MQPGRHEALPASDVITGTQHGQTGRRERTHQYTVCTFLHTHENMHISRHTHAHTQGCSQRGTPQNTVYPVLYWQEKLTHQQYLELHRMRYIVDVVDATQQQSSLHNFWQKIKHDGHLYLTLWTLGYIWQEICFTAQILLSGTNQEMGTVFCLQIKIKQQRSFGVSEYMGRVPTGTQQATPQKSVCNG